MAFQHSIISAQTYTIQLLDFLSGLDKNAPVIEERKKTFDTFYKMAIHAKCNIENFDPSL